MNPWLVEEKSNVSGMIRISIDKEETINPWMIRVADAWIEDYEQQSITDGRVAEWNIQLYDSWNMSND